MSAVGQWICNARKRLGLSQRELGAMVGVPQSFIAKIELGADVRISTLARVLEPLGLSMRLEHDVASLFRDPPAGSELAAARDFGVDMGQLYERFRMTPAERLELAQANSTGLSELFS